MKKLIFIETMCLVIIMAAVLIASICAAAPALTPKPTALEEKLYQAAVKEGELVYWDSLGIREAQAFINAFGKRYPGIKVTYWEATAGDRQEKLMAEYRIGKYTADIDTIDYYQQFKDKGLLANFSDVIKDMNYPKEFYSKDFDAVSIEFAVYGAAYNTKSISSKDIPRTWEGMLDPKFKGKINLEDRMKFFVMNTAFWGEEKTIAYLKKLREQNTTFSSGGSATMTLLTAGEFPIALSVMLHSVLREQAKGAPVAWVPINPALVRLAPYIIPRQAPHMNAAKLFLRWLMSPDGQSTVDQVRMKGNPAPGAGTVQSKTLEKLGITKLVTSATWDVEFEELQGRYEEAVGLKKK